MLETFDSSMRSHRKIFALFLICWAVLFASAAQPISDLRPTVILISIDGFRADYLDKIDTPNLHSIVQRGTRAKYMVPVFPSKTFPNHYTIVTGLYPAHHGIVANTMYDPETKAKFKIEDRTAVHDPRWWGGEPIWVTAEKQGIRTAPLTWPGGSTAVDGIAPSYTMDWTDTLTFEERLDRLTSLLDLPVKERPQFLTFYFNDVDDAGHDFGPLSPEVRKTVQDVDSRIGQLLAALRERGIEERVNVVVVSDHGMSPISAKKVVYLDKYVDPATVDIIDGSPVMALRPKDGNVEALYKKAIRIPHAKAYTAANMPQRWHYTGNARIAPVIVVADEEWTINTREYLASHPVKGGTHGFDNGRKNMRALFIAAGPTIQPGKIKPFANIHVYSLLAYLLNVRPAANDGSIDAFKSVLTQRSETPVRKERAPWQKEWDEVAANRVNRGQWTVVSEPWTVSIDGN